MSGENASASPGDGRRPREVDPGRRVDRVASRTGSCKRPERVRPPRERPDRRCRGPSRSRHDPARVREQAPAEVAERDRRVAEEDEQVRAPASQHEPRLTAARDGRAEVVEEHAADRRRRAERAQQLPPRVGVRGVDDDRADVLRADERRARRRRRVAGPRSRTAPRRPESGGTGRAAAGGRSRRPSGTRSRSRPATASRRRCCRTGARAGSLPARGSRGTASRDERGAAPASCTTRRDRRSGRSRRSRAARRRRGRPTARAASRAPERGDRRRRERDVRAEADGQRVVERGQLREQVVRQRHDAVAGDDERRPERDRTRASDRLATRKRPRRVRHSATANQTTITSSGSAEVRAALEVVPGEARRDRPRSAPVATAASRVGTTKFGEVGAPAARVVDRLGLEVGEREVEERRRHDGAEAVRGERPESASSRSRTPARTSSREQRAPRRARASA